MERPGALRPHDGVPTPEIITPGILVKDHGPQLLGLKAGSQRVAPRIVKACAQASAIFCPAALIALVAADRGAGMEREALLYFSCVAAALWAHEGVYRSKQFTRSWLLITSAIWFLHALSPPTIGDQLAWVALAGLPALVAVSIWFACLSLEEYPEARQAQATFGFVAFGWAAGWLLFFFNAPENYQPVLMEASAISLLQWVVASVVAVLVYGSIFTFFTAFLWVKICNNIGVDPADIIRAVARSTQRPGRLAKTYFAQQQPSAITDDEI